MPRQATQSVPSNVRPRIILMLGGLPSGIHDRVPGAVQSNGDRLLGAGGYRGHIPGTLAIGAASGCVRAPAIAARARAFGVPEGTRPVCPMRFDRCQRWLRRLSLTLAPDCGRLMSRRLRDQVRWSAMSLRAGAEPLPSDLLRPSVGGAWNSSRRVRQMAVKKDLRGSST